MSESSSTSNRVDDLVRRSRPTNAPRRIHRVLAIRGEPGDSSFMSRVLHAQPGVREATLQFSRCWWDSCDIIFVPTINAANCTLIITVSAVPEDVLPTNVRELKETPACRIFVSGGTDRLPDTVVYKINFADAGTNPLIRPAPIEEKRTAVVMHFDCIRADGEPLIDDALLEIYIAGHIICGGQN